jgi:hypothetical protein
MQVERYQPARHEPVWDDFVRASKNGTFLLLRGYMDYHADRFADHSLLVHDPEGRLLALLPAHAERDRLVSHGGLTYGGFITGPEMKTPLMLGVFEVVAEYLRDRGFGEWMYKTVPHIYHRQPAEEDRYALFLAGAALVRRDVLAVVGRHDRLPYQQRRERAVRKARQAGLTVAEDVDLAPFWDVLAENLAQRHDARPVHSLDEIRNLRERFPDHIRLFTCRTGGEPLGGVLVYESASVAHVQYIASTEEGRRAGALDLIFDALLTGVYALKPYFDFGISNEENGRRLNRGLIDQKEGFGARAVAHDHYAIDLAAWEPGRLTRAMS